MSEIARSALSGQRLKVTVLRLLGNPGGTGRQARPRALPASPQNRRWPLSTWDGRIALSWA